MQRMGHISHSALAGLGLSSALLVLSNKVHTGDEGAITIGDNSNLQDNVSVRTSKAYLGEHAVATTIGSNVTVGHGVLLDSVTIEDEALIGMGATLMEGVKVCPCCCCCCC